MSSTRMWTLMNSGALLLTILLLATPFLDAATAHMSMIYPLSRGHPSNPNAGTTDYNCRDAPLSDRCSIRKTFPCGGYPPDKKIVQTFKAGEVIDVRFGNAQFGSEGQAPLTPTSNQARHSGGLCEFSLSYDQGTTFGVFARYHGSCPDMFYSWPIKFPSNLPSCDNCILGWSWINADSERPEYYMGCADIKIEGEGGYGPLPREIADIPLRMANMPGYPTYHALGDQFGNAKSNGPSRAESEANKRGETGGPDKTIYERRKRSHGRRMLIDDRL